MGIPKTDIAKQLGVSRNAVYLALDDIKSMVMEPEALQAYQSKQADIFDNIAAVYSLELLDRDKIKETKARDAAVIAGIVTEKSRLIRGQATQRTEVDIRALIAAIDTNTITSTITSDIPAADYIDNSDT